MHSEHLSNVRPSWVAFGWFIAAALASAVFFGLIALGLVGPDGEDGTGWMMLAGAIGFFGGGYAAGARAGAAPILHGVGIGLFSLLVWAAANALLGVPARATTWSAAGYRFAGLFVILQIVVAASGARFGARASRRPTRTPAG